MKKIFTGFMVFFLIAFLAGCGDWDGGSGSNNSPPTVSSTSPANVSTDVALNKKISANFSEAMGSATITPTTFTVTGPGTTPVSGTVNCVGATATFTPQSDLAGYTTFTATITRGAENLAGDALANNFVWTFTTGGAPDTTAPAVSTTVPANAATGVGINTKIAATFSEAMESETITPTTFTLTGPGVIPVEGIVTYSGVTAVLTPSSPLDYDANYTATITFDVEDLAGNAMAENFEWTFTTGSAPDITAPVVSSTDPANLATGVAVNKKIAATFSEAMDPETITLSTFAVTGPGMTPVPGTVTYSGVTAIFTPAGNLAYNTIYTATITNGSEDLAGNALASDFGGSGWHFTTGDAPDTTAPVVSSTDPANLASGVAVNKKIAATFSEAMDPLRITSATFAVTGPGGIPVSGVVDYSGVTGTFTPKAALDYGATYTATITTGARDLAGNVLANDYLWSFTTGNAPDTTPPTVTLTKPADLATAVAVNTKVSATFSETMDTLTLTTTTFTLKKGVAPVSGAVTYSGVIAVFAPSIPLDYSTTYTAEITTGARDLAGHALATSYTWSFTTGAIPDATAPTVTLTTPADLETDVAVNKKVAATFSEAMDPLTITAITFTLEEGAIPVSGTVTYSGVTAVFTPLIELDYNTTYTATITTGARDLAGNALVPGLVPNQWDFTTGGAPDTTPPTVTLTNPADLATDVALNSSVSATFSEAMDPLTISTATFTLAGAAGTVLYDVAGMIATFKPASNLDPNTTYTATITTGARDLAGNELAGNTMSGDYEWIFTTGSGLAPGAITLGSAATFGIMASSATTSTGATQINGDVSLSPGTSQGIPPAQVNGVIHVNDAEAALAKTALLDAYNEAKLLPPGVTVSGGADLSGLVLAPGTYTSGTTILINGPAPLTLDAGGNADAVWVFQIGTSLTTVAGGVSLINGAQAKNVFWVPTADATIGPNTAFYGTILAGRDVTGQTGATIYGRILAGAIGAATIALDSNTVNVPAP